jgi:hypothetical protein
MRPSELDALIHAAVLPLRERRVIEPLPEHAVRVICETYGLTRAAFCDTFALHVAEEFVAGKLTFEIADAAMNALNAYVQNDNETLPEYADDVYLAFDAGEYHHHEDPREVDPVEKYTMPEVRKLVSQRRG